MGLEIKLGTLKNAETSSLSTGLEVALRNLRYEVVQQRFASPLQPLSHYEVNLWLFRANYLPPLEAQYRVLGVMNRKADREVVVAGEESVQLENFARSMKIGVFTLRQEAYLLRYFSHITPRRMQEEEIAFPPLAFEKWQVDGLMLSLSETKRLGLEHYITQKCNPHAFPPAPGQGAVLLVGKNDWAPGEAIRNQFNHRPSEQSWQCEHSFAQTLRNRGVLAPVFGMATLVRDQLSFMGGWISPDGQEYVKVQKEGTAEDAVAIGKAAAESLRIKA